MRYDTAAGYKFNFHSLLRQLLKFKHETLPCTDLYVSPAAASAGPSAAHQALWDGALSAGRHGAGGWRPCCSNACKCSLSVWCSSQLTVCWFLPPPQLELKKTLLDRMVHLLSRGYVLPVVGYIRKCLEKLNTDISLIRYFVTEVTAVRELD